MKRSILASAIALALLACAPQVQAGITINQLPQKGAILYGLLPDGTLAPLSVFNGALPIIQGGNYTALGCFQITGLSSAKGLTTIPAGATLVAVSIEAQPVRMRDDGTNPTSSVGLYLPVGGPWPYSGNLSALKFIEVASSAVIDYCAYK